jgi:hypothetical protein
VNLVEHRRRSAMHVTRFKYDGLPPISAVSEVKTPLNCSCIAPEDESTVDDEGPAMKTAITGPQVAA